MKLQAIPWFTGCHSNTPRLRYIPELHGMVCEWLTDILAPPAGKTAEKSCDNRSMSSQVRCHKLSSMGKSML